MSKQNKLNYMFCELMEEFELPRYDLFDEKLLFEAEGDEEAPPTTSTTPEPSAAPPTDEDKDAPPADEGTPGDDIEMPPGSDVGNFGDEGDIDAGVDETIDPEEQKDEYYYIINLDNINGYLNKFKYIAMKYNLSENSHELNEIINNTFDMFTMMVVKLGKYKEDLLSFSSLIDKFNDMIVYITMALKAELIDKRDQEAKEQEAKRQAKKKKKQQTQGGNNVSTITIHPR